MTTPARLKLSLIAAIACMPLLFSGSAQASAHRHHHAHWHAGHHAVSQAMAALPTEPPVVHMRYFGGPKGGMWPEAR